MYLTRVIISLLVFVCSVAAAEAVAQGYSAGEEVKGLQLQAIERHLSGDRYWHALLHYQPVSGLAKNKVASEVITPGFFLSKDGRVDPEAELSETLAAFFLPAGTDPDEHAQCRFVARYKWLRKELDWSNVRPPEVPCRKYEDWSRRGLVSSISIVFATGYLSNPASLYGHMLVRFNVPEDLSPGGLLDAATSYGAIVPDHENGFSYVTKGLFGGYEAGFSNEQFYRHNHNYAETDLRDLWDYQLALSPAQVEQLVAHTWELMPVKFRYYFFNRNCAQRVAELLALVVDEPLLPGTPWDIPSTIFDRLAVIKNGNGMLVEHVRRIPSRQNRYYDKFFSLSPQEQEFVRSMALNPAFAEGEAFEAMGEETQARILETLFDYYEFRGANERDLEKFRSLKQVLLRKRALLKANLPEWKSSVAEPPHRGQPPFLVQTSLIENRQWGGGVGLRLRPAYYDFLAKHAGRLPESSLSMMDLRLVVREQHLRFQGLDLLSVETMNLSRTGLPGDGGFAWKLRLAIEQKDLSCLSCEMFVVHAGVGRALRLGNDFLGFVMMDGRVQAPDREAGTMAATPRLGVLYDPESFWRSRFSVGLRNYLDHSHDQDVVMQWENRFGNERRWDLRLDVEKNIVWQAAAGVSFYW